MDVMVKMWWWLDSGAEFVFIIKGTRRGLIVRCHIWVRSSGGSLDRWWKVDIWAAYDRSVLLYKVLGVQSSELRLSFHCMYRITCVRAASASSHGPQSR